MHFNKHCLFQVPCDVSFVVKQNQGKAMTKGSGQTEVFEIVPNRCTIFPYSEVYCVVHFTPAAIQLYSATIEVLTNSLFSPFCGEIQPIRVTF